MHRGAEVQAADVSGHLLNGDGRSYHYHIYQFTIVRQLGRGHQLYPS